MLQRSETLSGLLTSGFGDKTAVVIPDGGPALTYAELEEQVEALERELQRQGVTPGDRVSIALPNGLHIDHDGHCVANNHTAFVYHVAPTHTEVVTIDLGRR